MVRHGVFVLFLLSLILCSVVADAKPKVLLIESYHAEYSWDIEVTKGLKSVLHDRVELLRFQMNTKRLRQDQYISQADKAWKYYLDTKPDVVILADDNALKFLGKKFLSTDTPVVYMGINNNPRKYIPLNRNITGVLERPLYKRTIKYLNEILHVGQGKVLILLDEGTTTTVFKESVFHSSNSMVILGVVTDIKLISKLEDWKDVVESAADNGYEAIVIGLYHRVFDDNIHVDSEDVLQWTSENTPIPLFAFWGMSVGKGKAIGGMVISGDVQGSTAGRMVLEILGGTPTSRIKPAIPEQGRFLFSRHELDRWKIRLPISIKEQSRFVE